MTLEGKRLERLYRLLERAEREKDQDTAAALRWAIFTAERAYNIQAGGEGAEHDR